MAASDPPPNRRTVFILGAGCTRNYRPPSATNPIQPPLQADFFAKCSQYLQKFGMPATWHANEFERSKLLMGLLELFFDGNTDNTSLDGLARLEVNLEDAATMLDLQLRNRHTIPLFRAQADEYAQHDLHDLVVRVLSASTGYGECSQHRRLAECVRAGDTIISFNYDTLMDDALRAAGLVNCWSYHVPFTAIRHYESLEKRDDGVMFLDEKISLPTADDPAVHIVKLHGSFNWLACNFCGSMTYDNGVQSIGYMDFLRLCFEEYSGNKESTGLDRRLDSLIYSIEGGHLTVDGVRPELVARAKHDTEARERLRRVPVTMCPVCGLPLRRLFVPPLSSKQLDSGALKLIWKRAAEALRSAYRIFVIGYSLPATDFLSRLLLRTSTRWRRYSGRSIPTFRSCIPRHLVVIDPCLETFGRIGSEIWHERVTHHSNLDSFLVAEESLAGPR